MTTSAKDIFNHIIVSKESVAKRLVSVLELVEERPNALYLDIGCGDGSISIEVAKKTRTSNIFGVDISVKQLEMAKVKGINIVEWNAENGKALPFPKGFFDIITCLEVIEHLISPEPLMQEMYRLLSPKGYAIISTPRFDSFYTIAMLFIGFQPSSVIEPSLNQNYGGLDKQHYCPCGHIKSYTKRAMKEMLNFYGFKIIKYKENNIWSPKLCIIRKDQQIWKVIKRLP